MEEDVQSERQIKREKKTLKLERYIFRRRKKRETSFTYQPQGAHVLGESGEKDFGALEVAQGRKRTKWGRGRKLLRIKDEKDRVGEGGKNQTGDRRPSANPKTMRNGVETGEDKGIPGIHYAQTWKRGSLLQIGRVGRKTHQHITTIPRD